MCVHFMKIVSVYSLNSHVLTLILGQVWYLIVSIPDLYTLTYFDQAPRFVSSVLGLNYTPLSHARLIWVKMDFWLSPAITCIQA